MSKTRAGRRSHYRSLSTRLPPALGASVSALMVRAAAKGVAPRQSLCAEPADQPPLPPITAPKLVEVFATAGGERGRAEDDVPARCTTAPYRYRWPD